MEVMETKRLILRRFNSEDEADLHEYLSREGHFLQTGYFKHDEDGNPKWHDTYAYGLLDNEWRKLNNRVD